ncbi:protein fuzzy homolog isoform X1 [Danio rerio]|uniref:Fuzzy planar cell polarity protein n=2 Tax=Danio rerio TaxID=7955 RepID=E7F707_DANRE|nr:protein fuzzy homolog [Danio rerio]|eukprot:XP_001337543.1 protein fuzzy homolog [Danio rerio]
MLQAETLQLLCLTASSGVPLFSRGSSKQLPFSVIGSLNGVHMFGAGHGAQLSSCETDRGSRVVWGVFQDSLMLIAVSGSGGSSISQLQLRRLLENVWNCMVLVLGQDELSSIRNVERLKRELRSCYRLIDMLLERVNDEEGFMGDLTQCTDCLLPSHSGLLLQEAVDSFAQATESEFGCLLLNGRVARATEKWWSRLTPQEVVVLSVLVRSLADASSCDYPVFLPKGSPTVAIRLLSFQLLPGVHVCVLCGPKPSLHNASELISRFWSTLVENLRTCLEQAKRSSLPPSVSLRWDVQALLLINCDSRRALTVCPRVRVGAPAEDTPPLISTARRLELLRLFYVFAVTRYFTSQESTASDFAQGFTHVPVQCYLVTDECKCFGLQSPQHQLFLLMDPSVPTFALRTVATQTLSAITSATGF